MKHLITTVILLLVAAASLETHAGHSLAAYQGNANVHLLLFDTDNPHTVIKSVEINPVSEYVYLGNPTNIAYFDSPPKMLAFAVSKLLEALSTDNNKVHRLELDHFGVFIAGYEAFAHAQVCTKADGTGYLDEKIRLRANNAGAAGDCLTRDNGVPLLLENKETFFWRLFSQFNDELGQSVEAGHRLLKGDHLLLTQAARVRLISGQSAYELMDNIDLVQTTTCAPGYKVRGGVWTEGTPVSPDNSKDGGFHQLGRSACTHYLKPEKKPFKAGKPHGNIVLDKLESMPVAVAYAHHRKDSILNRWKKGFSNELGIAITMVLKNATFPEQDEDYSNAVQEQLIPLITGEPPRNYGVLQAVAESIRKLERSYVLLPDGRKNPIRLLGEFPWSKLGLKLFFRNELSSETYERLEFITAPDFEPMLTIAATNIFLHPELLDSGKGGENNP